MTSIRPLSESVRSSVRSGIFLFDLTRVVEELVFNSLDTGATKVSVFVNVGNCYIKVADDGAGITRDGLVLVGERYATSKFLNLADLNATSGNFGFRGEALASISEVSLLEIVTRTHGRPNGYRKVLKGCKCLYLGIDDDRKEVGTTVVVRDLFYNQPVRRKYMKSSPKKVLQSIKKCVLRLALVRPNVSFIVVDIESEDELLRTHSSSSALSLLTSGFGLEVSSSLLDLDVQDDIIKLSGYISGPCNSFTLKALQYVYINSQFVCKGPIHKLLSQLAIRFQLLDSWHAENEFQNKKRSRSQACPAYILNLTCPRSLYDLTFEPSKTYVQFKDWGYILNFIEKAIKQFWEENITCGILAGESSNHATYVVQADQTSKAGDDTISSEADKLTEDDYHLLDVENIRTTLGDLHRGTAKFKEQQTKKNFLCQAGYTSNLLDGSYAKCVSTVNKNQNNLWMYDNSGLSGGDYFLDGKFAAAESFNDNAALDAPSSSQGNQFVNVNTDVVDKSSESALPYDFHEFCNDVSEDFQKPLLKSCSLQGTVLHEKAFFASGEADFQAERFRTKQYMGEDCGSDEDLRSHPCAVAEENCHHSDTCYLARQMGDFGFDNELLNSAWYPLYQEPLSKVTAWDVDHMTDNKDFVGTSGYYKRDRYIKLLDKENKCNFSYNMSRSSNQNYFTSSFENSGLDLLGPSDCKKIFHRLVDSLNCDDICCTKWLDISTDESDWLCPESCGENYERLRKKRGKMDHFRYPGFEKNHERSRRSFSAPPFHRSKRRFFSLNQPLTVIAKNPAGKTSKDAPNYEEAGESKCPQHSSGAFHPSTDEHLLLETRPNTKQRPDRVGDNQIKETGEFDGVQSFNIQSNAPLNGKVQGSIEYSTKWRNCSTQLPKNDKPLDTESQINILDISSGFLHLAGDSLVPETISKNCLEDAKVLHQVDKKFIPVVAGKTLAVIDQHAADERIRLEELRQKVLSGEGKTISYLDAEQQLELPEIGYQLLHNYSEQIRDWGWVCNIHVQDSNSFKKNLDILNKQPMVISLIAVPCILGVNLNDVDLMEFLQQLADTDGSSTMPLSVIRVLNLKACRGAIMFGDPLLPSECSLLVEELKHTSLCFQCAHGRPTTVPLVNLEALHSQIAKLGLMNDCSNDTRHGLYRQKVSFERAAQRLCSSRG